MKVRELNKKQLEQLKQRYYMEKENNVSYMELANIDTLVADEAIFTEYESLDFVEEDFF